MKMKTSKAHTVLILLGGTGLMFGPLALAQLAQTTPCPPGGGVSQSTSSGKSTQSKSTSTQAPSNKTAPAKNVSTQHQTGRRGNGGPSHDGARAGVGVGVNVDLGGIGQRRAEADPFAISGGISTSQTQEKPEKPKTKKTGHEVAKSDPFANVELTGAQAKDQTHDR
jgi:hypothetical protein